MDNKQLLQTVNELRAELSKAEGVDSEALAALEQLADDLRRKSGSGAASPPAAEPDTSGLNDLLLKFEADHPQLSVAVGRVADALAAMGI